MNPDEPAAMEGEHAILAQGSIDQLRPVRRLLAEGGLESELMAPPEGCGSA